MYADIDFIFLDTDDVYWILCLDYIEKEEKANVVIVLRIYSTMFGGAASQHIPIFYIFLTKRAKGRICEISFSMSMPAEGSSTV